MSRSRSNPLLPAGVLLSIASVGAVDLSGRVVSSSLQPVGVPGISIALAGTELSTRTDSGGFWSLQDPVGVASRPSGLRRVSSDLVVDGGRILVSFGGKDPLGRSMHRRATIHPTAASHAARTAEAPDTLTYAFEGKVFLRDTLQGLSQAGMIRTFDTTVNAAITHGYLTDSRDGHVYRVVRTGARPGWPRTSTTRATAPS